MTQANAVPQLCLQTSDVGAPFTFSTPGPGVVLFQDPSIFADGGSYAIDSVTGTHYMTYGYLKTPMEASGKVPSQAAVRLISSPLSNVTLP